MDRTADYTIQGFIYQFNKSLFEILNSADDTEISLEGIIEDIEVKTSHTVKVIQCKYHESQEKYTLSQLYKPILQMMSHFHENNLENINYVLYSYFPNEKPDCIRKLNDDELSEVLNTKNKDLTKYTSILKKIVITDFKSKFSIHFGDKLDELVKKIYLALKENGIAESDIETLSYPNAINEIANLSIKHDTNQRKITKFTLIKKLKQIKNTAITKWTLALRSRKQILDAKRKQLKINLDKNSRLRYFIFYPCNINDFDSEIVMFICDYLEKYHYKTAHVNTPIFYLDVSHDYLKNIQFRLYQKGIVTTDGFIGGQFEESYFYREPMYNKFERGRIKREFSVRLLTVKDNLSIINHKKCDDMYILGLNEVVGVDLNDINAEYFMGISLKEIKYIIGVSNVCE